MGLQQEVWKIIRHNIKTLIIIDFSLNVSFALTVKTSMRFSGSVSRSLVHMDQFWRRASMN